MVYVNYSGSDPTFNVCQIECTGQEKWIGNCKIVWRLFQCHNCLTNDVVGISCCKKSIDSYDVLSYDVSSVYTAFNTISPTTQRTNMDHHNCTNDNNYNTDSTSMPGIIAGAVGGVAAILILVAFIIGYLTYNRYAQAVHRSNGREFRNDDTISEPQPPPYQPAISTEKMSIQSTNSVPRNTLSDPPPNYSSLA